MTTSRILLILLVTCLAPLYGANATTAPDDTDADASTEETPWDESQLQVFKEQRGAAAFSLILSGGVMMGGVVLAAPTMGLSLLPTGVVSLNALSTGLGGLLGFRRGEVLATRLQLPQETAFLWRKAHHRLGIGAGMLLYGSLVHLLPLTTPIHPSTARGGADAFSLVLTQGNVVLGTLLMAEALHSMGRLQGGARKPSGLALATGFVSLVPNVILGVWGLSSGAGKREFGGSTFYPEGATEPRNLWAGVLGLASATGAATLVAIELGTTSAAARNRSESTPDEPHAGVSGRPPLFACGVGPSFPRKGMGISTTCSF